MLWLLALLLSSSALADAPEISRSQGQENGVVVLWPRVIPRSENPTARAAAFYVQEELERIVREVLPGRPIDKRPEPERVCPQAGCKAVALGAVVVHNRDACIAVATVSGPGRSAATLVPWAGQVDLKQLTVPFREPPESFVTIRDFASCKNLKVQLVGNDAAVRAAVGAQYGVSVVPSVSSQPSPDTRPVSNPVPEPSTEPVEGW